MCEIHYHLLYDLDDGPRTIEESIALAEASIAEGVTHIVCTPHANNTWSFNSQLFRSEIQLLNEHVGDRLTLGLGCDFHLTHHNIEDLHRNRSKYTINGKQYLLVELPDYGIAPDMSDVFQRMVASGIIPIITHPERNQTLVIDSSRLDDWMSLGCLVQITAASLLGRFGQKAETMAFRLLAQNCAHVIASDAHSIARRPPSMSLAHAAVKDRFEQEVADRLCIHNPRAVFYGEDLPAQPTPRPSTEEPKRRIWPFGHVRKH